MCEREIVDEGIMLGYELPAKQQLATKPPGAEHHDARDTDNFNVQVFRWNPLVWNLGDISCLETLS